MSPLRRPTDVQRVAFVEQSLYVESQGGRDLGRGLAHSLFDDGCLSGVVEAAGFRKATEDGVRRFIRSVRMTFNSEHSTYPSTRPPTPRPLTA